MTFQIADTIRIHHATKAKAMRLAAAFAADYPALTLLYATNEDETAIRAWDVVHVSPETEDQTVVVKGAAKVPELADVLEACDEAGVDPEEGYEEPQGGSVVPEAYRAKYREVSSNGQTNGDWLAEFLTAQCHTETGFDVDAFQAILDRNSVDQSGRWASLPGSGQKGWVGRWRMNGRQALEKAVAIAGEVIGVDGGTFEVPADFLAELRYKHRAFLDKRAKAEAKAAKEAA